MACESTALTLTITSRIHFGVDLDDEAKKIDEMIKSAVCLQTKPNIAKSVKVSSKLTDVRSIHS